LFLSVLGVRRGKALILTECRERARRTRLKRSQKRQELCHAVGGELDELISGRPALTVVPSDCLLEVVIDLIPRD
jgi:hypothetical protein